MLFVLLLFLHQACLSLSEPFQVVAPAAPVVAAAGKDTVLPCSLAPGINATDLEVRWFREDRKAMVCLYQYRRYNVNIQDPYYGGRAELFLEELGRGNVSLRLWDVRRSDHGHYKCMVLSPHYHSDADVQLAFTTLGSQPSVSLHSPGGGQTQLLCRSEGWFPAPAVIWTDRDGHDVTSLSSGTVEKDSQGLLSVSSYIPVQQESNIFSCLVRSALPEPDWESQLHIPRDFFPGPSGWMVAFCVTAAVIVAASALLVIQWRRMDREERQYEWQWLCSAAVNVTLDPDTAHPELTLSEDGKRVRLGEPRDVPDSQERFDCRLCVRGSEGFTSGRRYWEVEVNGDWRIGVTKESASVRSWVQFVPGDGYWCLESFSSQQSVRSKSVGVCVDIEERKVSFYTVESRTHIFTFTDMEFGQGEKIYPVFGTWDRSKDLVLLPPVRCGNERRH
ncbi:butyrophilin subfamily 1 member A1-like [Lepisosteus oculatus]|uniref:butyrophilin subfamily 1 member A1-like n=1 Tax=Lepisosteus oculatus TaxID=7918 RepID=UPI0037119516